MRCLNFQAEIVGLQGSGKSTLLAQLHEHLQKRSFKSHFVSLPQDRESYRSLLRQAFQQSTAGCVILFDGIERLGFFQRRALIRRTRASGLVVTKHYRGKLPPLIQLRTSQQLMTQLLNDLDLDQPEIIQAGKLAFEKHQGNIRDALRDLYDQCADGKFNKFLANVA